MNRPDETMIRPDFDLFVERRIRQLENELQLIDERAANLINEVNAQAARRRAPIERRIAPLREYLGAPQVMTLPFGILQLEPEDDTDDPTEEAAIPEASVACDGEPMEGEKIQYGEGRSIRYGSVAHRVWSLLQEAGPMTTRLIWLYRLTSKTRPAIRAALLGHEDLFYKKGNRWFSMDADLLPHHETPTNYHIEASRGKGIEASVFLHGVYGEGGGRGFVHYGGSVHRAYSLLCIEGPLLGGEIRRRVGGNPSSKMSRYSKAGVIFDHKRDGAPWSAEPGWMPVLPIQLVSREETD
jgi:hypothetical protein